MSDYLSGNVADSFVQEFISTTADLSRLFQELLTAKESDIESILTQKANGNEIMIFGKRLNDLIETVAMDDDVDNKKKLLSTIVICIKILLKESKVYFDILKIPEFDVSQLKDVISQAITEFKKTMHGCDDAFDKLLKSLDVFVDNFSTYYEDFQVSGREPSTLLFSFVDDVSKQYEGCDNK